jgi:general secretion pathway protein J
MRGSNPGVGSPPVPCPERRRGEWPSASGPGARAGRAGGFTLVELLIALVLIAIITTLMFSGLRLGSRAWEGVETVSERVSDLRVARNFIERTLRQARPASVVYEGEQVPVFAGDTERVELVAPLSEHVGVPGLYILRLVLEPNGEFERLVLVRWLLHPEVLAGDGEAPEWEPLLEAADIAADAGPFDRDLAAGAYGRTVLLPRVQDFELAYFGIVEGETEPEWQEEWLAEPRLPLRVRMALTTPEQTWPAAEIELSGGDIRSFGGIEDPTLQEIPPENAPPPQPDVGGLPDEED